MSRRTGPIRPEAAHRVISQDDVLIAGWQRANPADPELPWQPAGALEADRITSLVAGASTAVLVVGTSSAAGVLLRAALAGVRPGSRLYVFGDRALEGDGALLAQLGSLQDRVLARLGSRPPADWLVADSGREGVLLLGPRPDQPRWAASVDGGLSRSLWSAFRAMFWSAAVREGLPDRRGAVAWRAPLPSPGPALPSVVELPSGHLGLGVSLDDAITDAEHRVASSLADPGVARCVFLPPSKQAGGFGEGSTVDLTLPTALHARGCKVVWSDLGLPRTVISAERFVVDLVSEAAHLQLEWPRGAAVDLAHRLDRAALQPEWTFHPGRRLGTLTGQVLLQGSRVPRAPEDHRAVDLGAVPSPLESFETTNPDRFPVLPALVRKVEFGWTRVPPRAPAGSRPAKLVKQWTLVDEWAKGRVETCRVLIGRLESAETSLIDRLKRFLPQNDGTSRSLRRLRDELDTLAEVRPSEDPDGASARIRELAAVTGRFAALEAEAHERRQKAKDAADEDEQRQAFEARRATHVAAFAEARAGLEAAEALLAAAEMSPSADRTKEEAAAAKKATKTARKGRDVARAAAQKHETALAAEFRFLPGARLPAPPSPAVTAAPDVPTEAPPELGDLFEHDGQRYLAVRTWEQVQIALPVARRLGARPVASTP